MNKPAYLPDMRVFPCFIVGCGSFVCDSVSLMRRQNRISDSNPSRSWPAGFRITAAAFLRRAGHTIIYHLPAGIPLLCELLPSKCVDSVDFFAVKPVCQISIVLYLFAFSVSHPLQLSSALKIF